MTDKLLVSDLLSTVEFDSEGFVVDPTAWTPELGRAIADAIGIALTDRHWIVINFAREQFESEGEPPTLRRITKLTEVDTKELYALFPGGAAKVASKISGLGKPKGCI
jgi:tRNA 2-thiouridine synthesizing protein E